MRGYDLLQKMELVDAEYIEAADQPVKPKPVRSFFHRPIAACIAIATLLTAATTVVASGTYDDLLLYFKGDTQLYIDGIIASSTSVSNEEMTMRIDGVIADSHSCHMVVSFLGLSQEEQAQFTSIHPSEKLDVYAVSHSGLPVPFWNSSAAFHWQRNHLREMTASQFEDADVSCILSCDWDSHTSMEDIKSICISYRDLTAELDIRQYITPEYSLTSSDPEADRLTNVRISSLGLYFDVPVDIFPEDYATCDPDDMPTFQIQMIRTDGSLLTEEEMPFGLSIATGYNKEDEYAHVSGAWKGGSEFTIYILDLSEYCGVQINGVNYYF